MGRLTALLAVLAVTVFAAFHALSVTFDPSIEVYFLDGDEGVEAYHHFLDTFDSDQILVVAYEDPELWTADGLAFLDRMSRELGKHDNVQHVRSITTLQDVVAQPGSLTTRPYYDADDPPEPMSLREWVLGNEILRGSVVSEDGRVVAIFLTIDHLLEDPQRRMALARTVRDQATAMTEQRGLDLHISGPAILDEAFIAHTNRDILLTFPLMGAVIILAIFGLFRTWRALPLPLAVIGLACLWTAGMMGLLNYRVTIIHSIVFPMLMGIGIASSVHVLSRAMLLRRTGLGPQEAAQQSLKTLLAPCFFTTATTVAGMSSLLFTTMRPLRQVGVLAAFGVSAALLLTYALGPWLLPLLPQPSDDDGALEGWWSKWDDAMAALATFCRVRARAIVIVSVAFLLFMLLGLQFLKVGSNPIVYFLEDDPVRIDVQYIDEHLAGASTIEVFVDVPRDDAMKEPETLRKLAEVQSYLEGLEGVGETFSVAEYVMELRQAMRGGLEGERRIPDTKAEVSQLLLMIDDPANLERLVDFTYRKARVNATIKLSDGDLLQTRVREVELALAERFSGDSEAMVTGQSKLIANMNHYMLRSTQRSMGAAFGLVLLFMTLALRSVRLGLFSMIPNVMPIGITLGLMAWTGIRLDPGTTMIGAIALGLVVDDTVHFLHHFRERLLAGDTVDAAIQSTLHDTGRAIIMTSLTLTAAFWLMLLSSFYPNIYFGLLTGVAILLAVIADLIVLPAALALVPPSFLGSAAER